MRTAWLAFAFASCGSPSETDRRRPSGDDVDDPAWCHGREGDSTADGPCGCTADCDAPEICLSEEESGVPGGFCLRRCSDECPAGTFCGSGGWCRSACTETADCRPGWVCTTLGIAGEPLFCAGQCQDDADCVVWDECNEWAGTCGDFFDSPGQGGIGSACANDTDCMSGACLVGSDVPGGYCSTLCSVSRQGCPEDAYCARQFPGDDMGFCFATCASADDCRAEEGYGCIDSADAPGTSVCFLP